MQHGPCEERTLAAASTLNPRDVLEAQRININKDHALAWAKLCIRKAKTMYVCLSALKVCIAHIFYGLAVMTLYRSINKVIIIIACFAVKPEVLILLT